MSDRLMALLINIWGELGRISLMENGDFISLGILNLKYQKDLYVDTFVGNWKCKLVVEKKSR